jgi:hypothetical protein
MLVLCVASWYLVNGLFGVSALLTSVVIALCYGGFPGELDWRLKLGTLLAGFAVNITMFCVQPEWLGALALATAIVFIALLAKEPKRLPSLVRIVIIAGILLFDALVLSSGEGLRNLALMMPLVSLLIVLALIAYPRSHPSFPSDKWQ